MVLMILSFLLIFSAFLSEFLSSSYVFDSSFCLTKNGHYLEDNFCNETCLARAPDHFPRCTKSYWDLNKVNLKLSCWEFCEREMLEAWIKNNTRPAEGIEAYFAEWDFWIGSQFLGEDPMYDHHTKTYLTNIKYRDMHEMRDYLARCYPALINEKKAAADLKLSESTYLFSFISQFSLSLFATFFTLVSSLMLIVLYLLKQPLLMVAFLTLAIIIWSASNNNF